MICVDQLRFRKRHSLPDKFSESCHLFSDDGDWDELHKFAEKIGLLRWWFQDLTRVRYPHYDLTYGMRVKAVKAGAVEKDTRYFIRSGRQYMNQEPVNEAMKRRW